MKPHSLQEIAVGGGDAELPSICKRLPSSLLATEEGLQMLASAMAPAADAPDAPVPSLTVPGAALIVEVDGVGALARVLARSHAPAEAASKLASALNELLARIGGRMHRHGAELLSVQGPSGPPAALAFVSARGAGGGDGGAGGLREAAAAALAVAREVALVAVEWSGHRLAPRLSLGVGTLELTCLRAVDGADLLFGGDAVTQARGAQRAAWGSELLLSAEAARVLGELAPSDALPAPSTFRRALPVSPPAPAPAPAGAAACACGWVRSPRLATGPAVRAALAPYLPLLRRLAPPAPPMELRRAAVLAAALGGPPPSASAAPGLTGIFSALLAAAGEHGGRFGGIWLDGQSLVALLWFGLGGSPPEDDPERAVRAALAIQAWLESAGVPFSCGVAEGPVYQGAVGAPCRLSFTLVGDAVSAAARLMEEARAAKAGPVLCSGGLVDAVAAHAEAPEVHFEESASVRVEGCEGPVRAYRPSRGPPGVGSPTRRGSRALAVSFRRHAPEFVVDGCCGRDAELRRVRNHLDALCGPGRRGFSLVLEGEGGFGKTCFLRQIERESAARGVVVLSAAAHPEDSAPLAPLRRLLWRLAGPGGDEAALAELLAARGLLAEADAIFFRGPGARAGAGPPGGVTSFQVASAFGSEHGPHDRAAEAFARILGAVAEGRLPVAPAGHRRPTSAWGAATDEAEDAPSAVLLMVDDAHHLDSASWYVLESLREECPGLALVVAARPIPNPPVALALFAGRGRGGDSQPPSPSPAPAHRSRRPSATAATAALHVGLGALDPGPARELLEGLTAALGIRWAPGILEAAVEASGGSPVYLVEAGRLAAARGGLGPGDLPGTIGGIALAHLALLSPAAQAVARVGAVVGGGFSVESVRALDPAGDASFARVLAGFLQLRRAGLIHEGGPEPPGDGDDERWPAASVEFRFSNRQIQDAVYEAVPEDTRREVHARYATWIAARAALEGTGLAGSSGAPGSDVWRALAPSARDSVVSADGAARASPALLALHLCLAGDLRAAASQLEAAAGEAVRSAAVPEARQTLAELILAIDTLALAGPGVPPLPARLREDALQIAGGRTRKALAAAGEPAQRPAEDLVGAEAHRRWRAIRLQALKQWGYVEYVFGRVDVAAAVAHAALESLGRPVRPRAPSPGLLFEAWRLARKLAAGRAGAERVAPLTERSGRGSEETEAEAEAEDALGEDDETVATHCTVLVAWCASKRVLGRARNETFRTAVGAALCAAELVAARRAAGRPLYAAHVRACAVFSTFLRVAGMRGLAESVLGFGEAVAASRAASDPTTSGYGAILTIRGFQAAMAGDLRGAEEAFERSLGFYASNTSLHPVETTTSCCLLRILSGRLAEGADLARRSLALMSRIGSRGFGSVGYLALCGFAALLKGRPAEAEKLAGSLSPAAEAADFWMQSTLQFVGGIARWQLRGDAGELAAAARAFLPTWRNDIPAATWLAFLSIFCCVEYAQWAEAEAAGRLGRPRPRLALFGGPPKAAAPADAAHRAARAFARETIAALSESARRRLPLLAPMVDLAHGSEPGARPARAARLLRRARAGFAAAGLPFLAALAGVRLSWAELAGGSPREAEAARAQAARTAAAIGLALPSLSRPLADGEPAELSRQGHVPFASMWV